MPTIIYPFGKLSFPRPTQKRKFERRKAAGEESPGPGAAFLSWDNDTQNNVRLKWDDENGNSQSIAWDK